jgi:hypothetical protein
MTKQKEAVLSHETPKGLNISKSYFPAEIVPYNEWCRLLGVSTQVPTQEQMYQGNQIDLTKLKTK